MNIPNNLIHSNCLEHLPDSTRIWLFHSTRLFTEQEAENLIAGLKKFVTEWTSHNRDLDADTVLLYNRFIILAVNETVADASGCSIDTSVRFLKTIEQHFQTQLFDRFWLAYRDQNKQIISASKDTLSTLFRNGEIDANTPVFNTLVSNLGDLRNHFELRLDDSWYKRLF